MLLMRCVLLAPKHAMHGKQREQLASVVLLGVDSNMGSTREEQGFVRWTIPPQIILCTELHIGADNGNLHCDEHRQRAHHETEPKDVVKIPLQEMDKEVSLHSVTLDG